MNVSFFISVKDIAVALRERDTSVGRLKMGAAVLSYTPWRCGPEWGPLVGLNNGHTLHLAQLAFTLKCCSYTEVTSERNDVRYDLHKWQKKEKHLSVTAAWSGIRRQPGKDEANDTPSVPCAHLLLPPFSDSTATTHPPHPHCASVHIRYCCWLHLDPGRMGGGGLMLIDFPLFFQHHSALQDITGFSQTQVTKQSLKASVQDWCTTPCFSFQQRIQQRFN